MHKVAVIGTGNLAWHLVPKLLDIGLAVDVISRQLPKPEEAAHWGLAKVVGWASWVAIKKSVSYDAVFLAVPDAAITTTSQQVQSILPATCPIVHTSGATAVEAIDSYFEQRGVLWPIRSLKKGSATESWEVLPLVYFSEHPDLAQRLAQWAKQLSSITCSLADEQRAWLHLAAVFSNNFTNYLCHIAYQICKKNELPFSALLPIIHHSFETLDEQPPILRQTGAAARGDTNSIERHLELLAEEPEWQALYQRISELIVKNMKV